MGKLKNRPPEMCAYRHCSDEFRPKREAQRFCSQRCRKAYNYDVTRTSKKPRKRALKSVEKLPGSSIPESVEKHKKGAGKTAPYKGHVTLTKRCGTTQNLGPTARRKHPEVHKYELELTERAQRLRGVK